jgi:hypothetical protein
MSANKFIVTTTIYKPSIAINKFAQLNDWTLIIVGDKKTPHDDYYDLQKTHKNVIYLDTVYQHNNYNLLSTLIGWNCIQRRNIGYIEAYKRGADIIASIDDDNIPYDNWGKEILLNQNIVCDYYYNTDDKINIWDPISTTKYNYLWHRGFPLELIKTKNNIKSKKMSIVPSVQADLWNGDPDVDAIERLQYDLNCNFDDEQFPFFGKGISPFNSQNTFFTRNSIKDYYLFPYVGRMDDIWGSFYLQSKGHNVIYNKPTVFQDRNVHNYMNDFMKEYDGYIHNKDLIESLFINPENIKKFIPELSWNSFQEYKKYF